MTILESLKLDFGSDKKLKDIPSRLNFDDGSELDLSSGMNLTKEFEGFSPNIYKDIKGNPTIGYGFNIGDNRVSFRLPEDVIKGERDLSQDEANGIFEELYLSARNDAKIFLGEETFNNLDETRQNIVVDMSYNLGLPKLRKFEKMREALIKGDFNKASDEIQNSKFFKQVGRRGKHHVAVMKGQSFDLSFLNPFAVKEAEAGELPVEKSKPFEEIFTEEFVDREIQQNLDKEFARMADIVTGTATPDKIDFVGNAVEILSGGMTLEEAEAHKEEVLNRVRRIPGTTLAVIKLIRDTLTSDIEKAKEFFNNPIEALVSEPIPEKTILEDEALEGFSNIFEFIFNPFVKLSRGIGGFVFPEEEGTLKNRLKQSVKDVIKEPGAGFIAQRIGEDIFTGEESTLERVSKLAGVTIAGTIAEVLTFNPRGIFNSVKKFPASQKVKRMNEIIAEVEKDVPRLKKVLKQSRPDLPQHVVDGLEARDFIVGAEFNPQLGNYLKAVTEKVVPRFDPLLRTRAGAAKLPGGFPFKKGDIVRIGKETGKILEISGPKAIVDIAGKNVEKNLSELSLEKSKVIKPFEIAQELIPDIDTSTITIESLFSKSGMIREFKEILDTKVKIVSDIEGGKAQGQFLETTNTILIQKGLSEKRFNEVLKHEMIHALDIKKALKTSEENVAKQIESGLIGQPSIEFKGVEIPKFKNTEEAQEFGKSIQGNEQAIDELKALKEAKNKEAEEVRAIENPTDEQLQQGLNLATEGQFLREALEEAQKFPKKPLELTADDKAEMELFIEDFLKVEKDLTTAIKELGGVKAFKGGKEIEEFKEIPSDLKNKEGLPLDEMATELESLGFKFEDGEELRQALIASKGKPKFEVSQESKELLASRKKTIAETLRIGKLLAKQPTPGKVKSIITKVTGVKRIEKEVKTTERQELKRRLRTLSKGIKEGFREGVSFEKIRSNAKEAIKLINEIDKVQDKIEAAIEIEEAIGVPFESKSSAFNEHVAYFQTKQVPPGSKARGLLKRIRTIGRLRQSGKIKPSQANRITRRLRKKLFNEARKDNIAIRMTKGGKIILSIRDSGVFVSEDFANYKKFKDLSMVGGGGTDITRMIQGMDGALTVSQKSKLPGQAGPLEQNVLWPTRDIMIQKISYIREKMIDLKMIFSGVKANSPTDEKITRIAEQISLDDLIKTPEQLLKIDAINNLTDDLKLIGKAKELRIWYTDLINEMNSMRSIRNQDQIPLRDKYQPQELLDQTLWERYGRSDKTPSDVLEGKGNLPDYIKPNKPFNPREKAREFGIPYKKRLKSALELSENYLATSAKDIFNTSIIQNNKAYIQQLETMGFKESAKSLADWNAEAFAGINPAFDRAINLPQGWKKGMVFFNKLRNMAVFPFNISWNLLTQTSSFTTLTTTRFGAVNAIKGMLNYSLNPITRQNIAKNYFSFIIKANKSGRLSRQDANNLIGAGIKIYKTPLQAIEDFSFIFGDSIERLLTGASIEAARLDGIRRGLKGQALRNFASEGGGKTQSMYNDEDKPGVLRSLSVKTFFPYQTFAFEVQNTFREWLGKTGSPPDNRTERILWLMRFMAGATVSATLAKKAGKTLWDWKRSPLPFSEMWLNPIISKINGEYFDVKRVLPSPIQMTVRFSEGIDNLLERGDTRKLRNESLKWFPSLLGIPGGIQISRTVDALFAYAEGGVYNRSGRKMFGVETDEDLLIGIFSGVWATQGGQAYLKKREKQGLFDEFTIDELLDNITGLSPEERKKRAKERRKRKRLEKKSKKKVSDIINKGLKF